MRPVARGIVWLAVFVGICLAPLVFALVGTNRAGQGFWTDFSVALGFVGLALMGVEFALVARIRAVAEPFGTDADSIADIDALQPQRGAAGFETGEVE